MKSSLSAAAGLLLAVAALAPAGRTEDAPPAVFRPGARVLFQGDSITDMNRGRTDDPNHILGHSYAFLIAARQGADFPGQQVTFINRGIGGNRVADLVQRWSSDTLELKPDIVSILIGVNDVLIGYWQHQPVSIDTYEQTYDQLLATTLAANPRIKLVLCEPFILPGKNTREKWEEWQSTMKAMRAAVARLAAKFHAPVVHLQKVFDDACQRGPIEYWIWDGIHPTYAGQQLVADEWMRTVRAFYGTPASKP